MGKGGRGRRPPLRLCYTLHCTRTQCATYDIFAVFVLLAGFCIVLPRPHHPSPNLPPGMAWSHLIEKLSFNCREERQKQVEREGKQQNKNLPLAFVYNSSSIVPRTKVGNEHGNWQWRRLRLRLRRVLCVVWLRDACPAIAPNGFSIASTRLALPCLALNWTGTCTSRSTPCHHSLRPVNTRQSRSVHKEESRLKLNNQNKELKNWTIASQSLLSCVS